MPTDRTNAQSSLDFRLMSLTYRVRDWLRPRRIILAEVGIRTGFQVLDYGCGPGSYIAPLAALVGDKGRVYGLDMNPLAIRFVQKLAAKKRLGNVRTILSDSDTGLPTGSMDVVLLYDILHDLDKPAQVLAELHRVLKADGTLSVSDHHLDETEIVSNVTLEGLFRLLARGKMTCSFASRSQ